MGLLMQKTTKLYLIIAILAVLSCSSYYILNESYGQTNEGESHQETPVLTPDSAGSVHTAVLPTQVSQAMQDDFANMEVPVSTRSVIYEFKYGTLHCGNGISFETRDTANIIIDGIWNSDTKVHHPEREDLRGVHPGFTVRIFSGDVFDGKFHLHGLGATRNPENICKDPIPIDYERYTVIDIFGYCDGSEGTIVINNGQYNITSTDAQFAAACTN